MCTIARTSASIHVIVHEPQTEDGRRALAGQVAAVHADLVSQYIQKLPCPSHQKTKLLDAVMETASGRKAGGPPR